jgi:hypothetical protein
LLSASSFYGSTPTPHPGVTMFNPWQPWRLYFDSLRLALDAQEVIGMRMTKLAEGGPSVGLEVHRMVSEKAIALWASQTAGAWAMMRGPTVASRKAAMPFRRAVRSNQRRLAKDRG